MEKLNTIVLVFLVVNTLFVFREKLWHKSVSTPVVIIASDIAYMFYTYSAIEWAVITWGIAITGLVANSAIRETNPSKILK